MKSIFTSSLLVVFLGLGLNADTIAGFGFGGSLGPSGLSTAVDGFQANRTSVSNGFQTSGSLSASEASAGFAANGSSASGAAFLAGLDATTTTQVGSNNPTGQQSLNIFSAPGGDFDAFTVNFTASNNVNFYYDHAGGPSAADYIDISYSVLGSDSFTNLDGYVGYGYGADFASSESTFGYNFVPGQDNAVVDLSAIANVDAIKVTLVGLSAGTRVAFDNLLVTGTAVIPEPSTYALVLGFIAFLLVARRK